MTLCVCVCVGGGGGVRYSYAINDMLSSPYFPIFVNLLSLLPTLASVYEYGISHHIVNALFGVINDSGLHVVCAKLPSPCISNPIVVLIT